MTRKELRHFTGATIVAVIAIFAAACGSDTSSNNATETPDMGTETSPDASDDSGTPVVVDPESRELLPDQPGVDPGGLTAEGVPELGQARAFRVEGDSPFTGIWAHCKDGDIRLVNAVVDICVSGAESNRYELFTGGAIVDAKRHDDEGDEIFDVLKGRIQLNVHFAESVETVRDGTDGGPAVVRITGRDMPVAHFVGAIGPAAFRSQQLTVVTELRLWPDTDAVEMLTIASNENDFGAGAVLGDWIAYGDEAATFRPKAGFDVEARADFSWSAGFGKGRAYGVVHPEEITSETLPLGDIPWLITREANATLPAGASEPIFRWFVVGERDAESIRRRAAELGAVELADEEQTVRLVDGSGEGLAGRLVEIWQGDEAVTALVTDDEGNATFRGEPGDYRVVAQVLPGEPAHDQEVALDGETAIELQQSGTISIEIDASAGGSTGTSRVTLFGPGRVDGVALHGSGEWQVAPGEWQVVIFRGPEWSYATDVVQVTAGETVDIAVTLEPTLDTEGWISGDFHQHMEPSIDSSVTVRDRVLDNVGHGVEFVAPTDHEAVTDLNPYIEELGLESELGTFPGVEISPVPSHFGIYPLEFQPDKRGRGTIELAVINDDGRAVQRTIPEIIELARQMPTDPIVQLNHARDGSGLFNSVDFDPENDPTMYTDRNFTLDFDVMEVINGFNDVCVLYRDFAGLWNAGYTPTALGNSDSHGKWGGVGQPRNWLHIDKAVGEVTAEDVRTAMLEHRVSVGANAFIDFGDGRLPGDTVVSSAGDSVDFHLRVQSANYASADTLIVVANGTVIDRRPIESVSDTVDFDDVVSYSFDEDTWVGFFVWGPRPAGDVQFSQPVMAFTNPLFIDVDGDTDSDGDVFEAPGIGALDLDQLDDDYCSF